MKELSNNIFKDYLKIDIFNFEYIIVFLFGIGVFFTAGYFTYEMGLFDYFILSLVVAPAVIIIIQYPKVWLGTVIISTLLLFIQYDEAFNVMDVLVGGFDLISLILWFIYRLGFKRKKIISNVGDFFLFFLLVILIFNGGIAVLNEIDPFLWLREYANFFLILYFFPIKHYFNDKKGIQQLIYLIGISIFLNSLWSFYSYYKAFTSDDVLYAYQLSRGLRYNQTLFTFGSIMGFVLAFSQKNIKKQFIYLVFTTLYVGALFISFSRTFWVVVFLAYVGLFFFISKKQRIIFILYALVTTVVFTSLIFLFAKENAKAYIGVLEKRVESMGQGKSDDSFKSRIQEYQDAWLYTEMYLLGGNGFAAKFWYYDPTAQFSMYKSNIHNGYLGFLFRWGIPVTIVFFISFFYYFVRSAEKIKSEDLTIRLVSLIGFSNALMLLIVNITSAQFLYRDGIFVTAYTLAFAAIAEKLYNEKKNKIEL